jgi:hypothetical protein
VTAARLRIEQQPKPFEIHLGHLAGRRRRHTHRIPAPAARFEAQAPDEALQGAVRNNHAAVTQQLLHTREL